MIARSLLASVVLLVAACASSPKATPVAPASPASIPVAGSDVDGAPLLMWRFSKDGGPVSYAFALPLGVKADTDLIPPRAVAALEAADAIVHAELIPGQKYRPDAGQDIISTRGMLPPEQSLRDLVPASTYDAVSAELGRNMPMLDRVRPWVAAAFVHTHLAQKEGFTPAQITLVQRAQKVPPSASPDIPNDMALTLLESLSYLEPEAELAFLKESVGRIGRKGVLEPDVEQAWRAGDADAAWQAILAHEVEAGEEHARLDKVLRNQARNHVKRAVLKAHEDKPRSLFVAVQLGVLMDDEGLLRSLMKAGYTVEQLRAEPR